MLTVRRPRLLLVVMLLLNAPSALPAAEHDPPSRMRVAVPVLDVRSEPLSADPSLDHDHHEETQLLYGELILLRGRRDHWARIESVEQREWTHHSRWEGYPGWVEAAGLVADNPDWVPNVVVTDKIGVIRATPHGDGLILLQVSMGTQLVVEHSPDPWWRVRLLDGRAGWILQRHVALLERLQTAISEEEIRQRILTAARQMLGDPYYWGGRSAHLAGLPAPPHTAVDCSGLTNLCYRAAGVAIPRDAHEQFLRARPQPLESLKPGDLIFLSEPNEPERITHVMLYAGDGRIIEGPGTGGQIHEIPLEVRLGSQPARSRRLVGGTYLP